MIEIADVSFSYPNGVPALSGISLSLKGGEFVLLTGWNGSGKTTLAKQLNGLLSPSSGTVFFDGKDIAGVPTSRLARDVGFVFQNPDHQLHKPTVREEIAFSMKNFGFSRDEIKHRTDEIARRLDLADLLGDSPQELTSSGKKLLTIASVLVYEPRVLIIDEAAASLDRVHADKIVSVLESYCGKDRLVLTISHNIPMWAESRLLNRVIVLENGTVLDDGTPRHVFTNDAVMARLTDGVLPVTKIARELQSVGVSPDLYGVGELLRELSPQLGGLHG